MLEHTEVEKLKTLERDIETGKKIVYDLNDSYCDDVGYIEPQYLKSSNGCPSAETLTTYSEQFQEDVTSNLKLVVPKKEMADMFRLQNSENDKALNDLKEVIKNAYGI